MRLLCVALLLTGACAGRVAPLRPRPEPAHEKLALADRLRREGSWEQAEGLYAEILAEDQGSVRAHAGLQAIELQRGRDLSLRRSYREGKDGYLSGRLEPKGERQIESYARAAEPYRSLGLGFASWQRAESGIARAQLERARGLDAGHPWMRVALGRYYLERNELGRAEAEFLAALWTEPQNPVAAHGMSVLCDRRGDYRGALRWSERAKGSAPAVERLAERAERVRRRGRRGGAATALGSEAPGEVEAFVRAFVRGVRARYRHYRATGEAESFEEFVGWARSLYTRKTGNALGPPGRPIEFAFVGSMIDASLESDEPLVREHARNGLLLVLAQRSGGPPEALLAKIARREGRRPVRVRGMRLERETVWTTTRYLSGYTEWSGGGDLAGLALHNLVIIDLDAIERWKTKSQRLVARLRPLETELLSEPALADDPVTAVDDPAGVAGRLLLVARPGLAGADLEAEVRVHEDAHLVDAARHLPVGSHLLRNLGLAFGRGFSSRGILAFLERNAQLTAIAEGPAPMAALAACCSAMGGEGPHAAGYGEIVQALVNEIAAHPERYREIDTGRVIVQQLHRLPAQKVRAAARTLMERWGVLVVGDS